MCIFLSNGIMHTVNPLFCNNGKFLASQVNSKMLTGQIHVAWTDENNLVSCHLCCHAVAPIVIAIEEADYL